jgi:hypothetical protein
MKTISRIPYALSVCAATAILAACGGLAQSPNPNALAPLVRARSGSSGNEVLRARLVTHCVFPLGCHFRTKHLGEATGPYPGTFTVKGSYGSGPLSEFFTIISGSSTITGSLTCNSSRCSYTSSLGNGKAKVKVSYGHLNDVLYGL